jgi:predicted TPR repeat methyltransferase
MTETGPLFVSSGDLISDRRYKAAVELAARGDFAGAADVLLQTVEAAPGFATAWFALAAIRDRLGDRDGAIAAFGAASRADPDDYHGARLQLARLGDGAAAPSMTEPYVRRLFDQYAGRYDSALTEHLHYRGPALLLDAVKSALAHSQHPLRFEQLLDLGCGTGLAGSVFRPLATRLVGVDLSAAMIARAEAKGDYDRLVVGNLAAFLSDEIGKGAEYDLVLAADVFVYLNDLGPALAAIARVLAPRGLVAFTVETHSGAGVALLPTLRFAHSERYLREAITSAGLNLLVLDGAAIRTEKGAPVDGLVVVAIDSRVDRLMPPG